MNSKYPIVMISLVALAVLIFTIGCPAENSKTSGGSSNEIKKNPAEQIWSEDLADFRSWELVPGTTAQMVGRGWHTALATIRGNTIALAAIEESPDDMPLGAILVKENFDEAGALVNIVVMKRQKRGWYWAQYSPGGLTEISGPGPDTCISCHGMAPNDRVFTWKKESTSVQ